MSARPPLVCPDSPDSALERLLLIHLAFPALQMAHFPPVHLDVPVLVHRILLFLLFHIKCKTTNSNTYLTTLNTHIIFKYLVKPSKNLHNKKQTAIRRLHHQSSVIESALDTKKEEGF